MNIDYMKRAVELALKGEGRTNPNPMVGAVIVKNGRIIGEGYHEQYGGLHAERNAFKSLSESAEGSDMYVTLEPCCHYGKTPPCTDAIIENKIKRVFIGSRDPNPLVAGKGMDILREHGIEVIPDVMRAECDKINEVFMHYIQTKLPYVVMKYAQTADGKICTVSGDSKWISCEESRREGHRMRNRYMGIMAGIGTVLSDDPMLNCRIPNGRSPIRIIADNMLRLPLNSNIVKTADNIPTYAVYAEENSACTASKAKALENSGVHTLAVPSENGMLNLKRLMELLGNMSIDSILIEGGGTLNYSALKSGIVNKIVTFTAPKIVGGAAAKTPVEGMGIENMSECFKLRLDSVKTIDSDIMAEYYVLN